MQKDSSLLFGEASRTEVIQSLGESCVKNTMRWHTKYIRQNYQKDLKISGEISFSSFNFLFFTNQPTEMIAVFFKILKPYLVLLDITR